MAIERRARLHSVEIMAHGPRLGGQHLLEYVDWDTEADAIVPGTGVLGMPQAIAFEAGDKGRAWSEIRDLIDVALIAGTNEARAEAEDLRQQRDRANAERDAAVQTTAKAERARDAMRTALAGNIEQQQAALAAEEQARAARAEVAKQGT